MRILAIAALLGCAVMIGCSPVYQTQYTLTPPTNKNGKHCVSQCQQTKTYCRQSAYDRHQVCLTDERARADREYTEYKVHQMLKKKKVWKSSSDFYNPRSCTGHGTYSQVCDNDFRGCFATCGGTVVPQTVCVANCE